MALMPQRMSASGAYRGGDRTGPLVHEPTKTTAPSTRTWRSLEAAGRTPRFRISVADLGFSIFALR